MNDEIKLSKSEIIGICELQNIVYEKKPTYEELQKIMNQFNNILKSYEIDKKFGQLSIESVCHLFPNEVIIIKDYITNLQEENKKLKKRNKEIYDGFMATNQELCNVTKEVERLKERCDYLQRSCDRKEEQRDYARMEYMEQEDYKLRCEKAIEYINHSQNYGKEKSIYINGDELLNILNGGDEE